MLTRRWIVSILAALPLITSGCAAEQPVPPASPSPGETLAPTTAPTTAPTIAPTEQALEIPAPYSLISQERMFAYLEDLTNLQPYSGWRNSATQGEAEAMDYVATTLAGFAHLQDLGLELERQSFRVFLATEIWESRLFLTLAGQEAEVPADAVSGHRRIVAQALRFDSDGRLNDSHPDPVKASGQMVLLRTHQEVLDLAQEDAAGKIVFLDFKVLDPQVVGPGVGAQLVTALIEKKVAGLVLVVAAGKGRSAQDGTFLEDLEMEEGIPMLHVRLEDLAPAGIASWDELAQVEAVRLIWDTDVFSPGQSGNLVARIPGADPSRAVILGAHIDSANTPGAGDNGFNSVVLLEAARVLDEGAVQPPVDIYLGWFGGEELGLLGAHHFVNTHPEDVDRALAALVMDGFSADDPGPTIFAMQEASYASFGDARMLLTDYITQKGEVYDVPIEWTLDSEFPSSDDGPFYGFAPAVRLAYGNQEIGYRLHGPYDTVDNVRDQGEVMERSARMSLIVALEAPLDAPNFRVTPSPDRRALILATHTEPLEMTATNLVHLDRALAWEGFDVDTMAYGQPFTAADLADADLVVALPVIDLPSAGGDPTLYDEQWSPDEIERLVEYVEQGGFLILVNSANHLDMRGRVLDVNEDWKDANALAASFGIRYSEEPFRTIRARVVGEHPITADLYDLALMTDNGLPFSVESGVVLAEAQGEPAVGLVEVGNAGGQVLALSDLGLLDLANPGEEERDNLDFLGRLARYVRER